MTAVVASLPHSAARRWPRLALLKNIVIGTLLSTNPLTAFVVLGWFVRRMRARMVDGADWPNWIAAPEQGGIRRWLGGLAANTREGVSAGSALFLLTLPFTALWALAWWAGWNNSFAKGYEDALFGPLLSLAAIAIALPLIAALPMALAHRAAAGRWASLFEVRSIMALIARVPLRYAALMMLWAVFALGTFAFRVLPLAAETIWPGFPGFDADAIQSIRNQITLAHAAVIFVSLLILRGLSARIYALAQVRLEGKRANIFTLSLAWLAMLAAAFAIVAQIYVAQFFNYRSWLWFSHPLLVLPGA